MKFKKLLFGIAFAFLAFSATAQFTFESQDGTVYESDDTYVTNSLVFSESSLDYRIINNTSEPIFMKVEIVSINGNDGDDFEFCFGLCYFGIEEGLTYPATVPLTIDANGDTGPGNHIWYGGPDVDESIVMDLQVRYFQTTEDGNTEIGDDFTFNYQYDPEALSIDDVEAQAGISINSTVLSNTLNFRSTIAGMVSLYDLQGRLISTSTYDVGQQSVDVSSLRSQMVIATFVTNEGSTQSIKLIKQ